MEDYKNLNHIRRYIAEQEKENQRLDQMEMPWIEEKR